MRTAVLLLATSLIMSCANTFRFEKDDLVAFGEIENKDDKPHYSLIRINFESHKDNDLPEFSIKLSSIAEPILLSDLNPVYVSKYLPPFVPPEQWPKIWKDKALAYQSYEGNGFYISFKKDCLSSFGACSNCYDTEQHPIIGKADMSVFYHLPLTPDQIVEIMGEPDRLYKVREVTY